MNYFKNNKKEVLFLIFRLLIIAISIIGVLAPTQNSFLGQFWFFTIQTNLLVIILMVIKVVYQFLKFFGTELKFVNKTWFNYVKIAITFYITITGCIYCFVLVPVAIVTNSALLSTLSYRDVFLHIFIPLMVILEYYSCEEKTFLNKKSAFLFLIYPLCYVIIIFIRAGLGGQPFSGGSAYPYFFIDPNFNNQGWVMVILYSVLCLVVFYLLALLYIFLNNKLTKKAT